MPYLVFDPDVLVPRQLKFLLPIAIALGQIEAEKM
jgi:hypothetical protein